MGYSGVEVSFTTEQAESWERNRVISTLKEISKTVGDTVPFNARDISYQAKELFSIRLTINEDCLTDDEEVMQAFHEAVESMNKIIEYHAANFVKLPDQQKEE